MFLIVVVGGPVCLDPETVFTHLKYGTGRLTILKLVGTDGALLLGVIAASESAV